MKIQFINVDKRLQSVIKMSNLKQIQVSREANISKNALSNYVNGYRIPDTLSLYKLSVILGVSMEWILTGEGLVSYDIYLKLLNMSTEVLMDLNIDFSKVYYKKD
ncbi:helix-turn-helix domain-containing protein [Hathewaya massiliensis]|uniref:helix-turn-helix domain-containing protein n=1 Tax=Hathewaya massiliensis TaxID=1964382 RepID=UPI00115A7FB1|nr:helix-turn-helix transcriptional regulator [Hathewaya massiliensis]